jgi:hypothetical protein
VPDEAWYVPARHDLQPLWAFSFWYWPDGQSMQSVLAPFSYRPVPQVLQPVWAFESWYWPDGQSMQPVLAPFSYRPVPHTVHEVE